MSIFTYLTTRLHRIIPYQGVLKEIMISILVFEKFEKVDFMIRVLKLQIKSILESW